jgi:amino acid adenylation domain-containing protein
MRVENGIIIDKPHRYEGSAASQAYLKEFDDVFVFPMSYTQQRFWFLDQLRPASCTYNCDFTIHLDGLPKIEVLRQAIEALVARHESLRTTFSTLDGAPVQIVLPRFEFEFPIVDIVGLPEAEKLAKATNLIAEESIRPFDLVKGPLLRVIFLRLDEINHIAIFALHHIICDGWSMKILNKELTTLCTAFSNGLPSPLADLPIQYPDFAVWQRSSLNRKALRTQLDYWKRRLTGVSGILELPTNRSRPAVQTMRAGALPLWLSIDLSEAIRTQTREQGVTLFTFLLAVFKTLLYRYTGQKSINVGTPVAGRGNLQIEGSIGCFVNTLVIHNKVSQELTFRELLRLVYDEVIDAYSNQDVPFERLVEEISPERSLSHSPLFQVMFVLQNYSSQGIEMDGIKLNPIGVSGRTAKFDLTLVMQELGQQICGGLEFSTDLFDFSTIGRMRDHLDTLFKEVVAYPDQRISEYRLLSAAERHQLLIEWNETRSDYPSHKCVHQLFEVQAEQRPDAVAVIIDQEQLSYSELNYRANQLAYFLLSLEVGPEMLVAICLHRSIDAVIAMLAVLKSGAAYLPLDPLLPFERLTYMLQDADASLIITQEQLVEVLPALSAQKLRMDSEWQIIAGHRRGNPNLPIDPDNLAYLMYTSGSTGEPKGISIPHRGIVRLVKESDYAELGPAEVILQLAPMTFDASTFEIWGSLLNGGKLALMGAENWGLAEMAEAIRKYEVSTLWLTAGLFHVMVDEQGEALAGLRQLLAGGDVLSGEHVERALEHGRARKVINGYGPTESTTFACCKGMRKKEEVGKNVKIGRPIANTRVYVLGAGEEIKPIGIAGELCIGGAGLARGYHKKAALTAEMFVPFAHGEERGERIYRTGDLARWAVGGEIEFLGRVDNQVKIRGFRIELEEIESALMQHENVCDAVVMTRADNSNDKQLVAYLVVRKEQPIAELRKFLKEKLPEYMLPSLFMFLSSLPLTPNGKVDRQALPSPDIPRGSLKASYLAPRDHFELKLSQIWEEILGIRPVGVRDSFFELGGHSLLAVSLMARVDRIFGRKLPLAMLFDGATIEIMASILRAEKVVSCDSPLVAIQPHGSKRPLYLVHPAGGNTLCYAALSRRLGPEQPLFAFEARSLDVQQPAHTSIEDMASQYLQALYSVDRNGPFFLGGWSMGGVVAYEMAQQLRAQGKEVALLALIDSGLHKPNWQSDQEKEIIMLTTFVQHLGLSLDLFTITLDDFFRLESNDRLAYILDTAKAANILPADISLSAAHKLLQAFKANVAAVHKYIPHPYDGSITLFKCSGRLNGSDNDPTDCWGRMTKRGLDIRITAGDHFNILREPNVKALAAQLTDCINIVEKARGIDKGKS